MQREEYLMIAAQNAAKVVVGNIKSFPPKGVGKDNNYSITLRVTSEKDPECTSEPRFRFHLVGLVEQALKGAGARCVWQGDNFVTYLEPKSKAPQPSGEPRPSKFIPLKLKR